MVRPPRDVLRREILSVARRLFSTVGFQATSLQMIAREVPCSKAALLYHFRTKSAILDALITGLAEDLATVVNEMSAQPEAERLAHGLELSVSLIVKHRDALAMLRGLEGLTDVSPLVSLCQERGEEATAMLLGPDPEPVDLAAAQIFQHGLLGACLHLPDVADAELAAALLRVGARVFQVDPDSMPEPIL